MEISLDNGLTFLSAAEAIEEIMRKDLWETVVNYMNDEIRERVHGELGPCSEMEFLVRYLELAEDNLVIG